MLPGMETYVESSAAISRLVQTALDGLRDGLQAWSSANSIPAGLAIDPATGHAFVEVQFVLLDGVDGINAASEQRTTGEQVSAVGPQSDLHSTSHGASTSVAAEGGGDSQTTDYSYEEIS